MATHFAFSPTFAFLGLVLCLHLLLVSGQLGPAPKKPADAEITPAQMAQLEEMQKNWTKLRRKMCDMKVPAADSSKLYNAMEACNKINHVYRIHVSLEICVPSSTKIDSNVCLTLTSNSSSRVMPSSLAFIPQIRRATLTLSVRNVNLRSVT